MVWDSLYEKSVAIAREVDIQPSAPRHFGRQQNRPNVPADNVSSFWRNMYLPFVNHLLTELDAGLLQANPRFPAQKRIPSAIQSDGLSSDVVSGKYQAFRTSLPVDENVFSGNVQDGVSGGQTQASLSTAQRPLAHFKEP
ncbi:hypothetical protein DPMN_094895 [Dreissena polymorpha]|uniref:Uncharacterized protein n=2 Tax=Dreissena polymorpha TaxID=45954 RepID=A0A9D4R324_DREPO|nr:hypothetical protein DPMN_094895 [Dreissena polymorpha]